MKSAWAVFAVFCFTLAAAWPQIPLAQTAGSTPSYESISADASRTSAASRRADAEKMQKQAAEYRELEKSARAYATSAKDIKDRAMWEKDAENRAAEAQRLEDEAARQIALADEEEGKATGLEGQVAEKQAAEAKKAEDYAKAAKEIEERNRAEQEAIDNNPNKGFRVANILGTWQFKDSDDPFIIVQKDGWFSAYPNRLEAHTPKRLWTGDFHSDPPPGKPLITFSYKPKAEEINPEIPEWAREKIAGTLEWTLEINAGGTCGTPQLSVDFYPGEVEWSEDEGGQVNVKGKGEARRFDIRPGIADMTFYSFGTSQLYLRPAGIKKDKAKAQPTGTTQIHVVRQTAENTGPAPAPIPVVSPAEEEGVPEFKPDLQTLDGLIEGQRFNVDVLLPPEVAEKQGDTLTVEISASGGDSTTLELKRGAVRKGRAVLYEHYDPITIADPHDVVEEDRDPPFLSMNYILGYQGERIDLSVKNGELVTFKFGEALQTVPVFKSWVQRGINQHQEAIERLRPFFNMILSDPTKTAAQKAAATKRLAMIQNYERIMESDTIHDYIRNKIGDAYFNENNGLIIESEENWQRNVENMSPWDGGSPSPLRDDERDGSKHISGTFKGVVWVHRYEKVRIENLAVSARTEYRETVLSELPVAMTFAMYEIVGGMSGFGDAFTLATGEDIFGKPVPGWQRGLAAWGLFNTVSLPFTLPHVMTPPSLHGFGSSQLSGRAMRAGARARLKQHHHVAEASFNRKVEAAVKTMSTAQKNSIGHGAEQTGEAGPSSEPIACARAGKNAPEAAPAPRANPRGVNDTPPENAMTGYERDPEMVARAYGPEVKYSRPGKTTLFRKQVLPTCQCASVQNAMAKAGLKPLSDMAALGFMVKEGIITPGADLPLVKGYTDAQAVAFMEALGAEVVVLKANGPGRVHTLEQMDIMMKRGWTYRDVLKPIGGQMEHTVQVEQFFRDADGRITKVEWFDSEAGDFLEAPSCHYLNKLASGGHDVIMYRFTEGDTPGKVTGQPRSTQADANPGSWKTNNDKVEQLDAKGRPINKAQAARVEKEAQLLGELINKMYPGERPPISVVAQEILEIMFQSQRWEQPSRGGASFSDGGAVGAVRTETIALKVKDGHTQFIEWKDYGPGGGKSPIYWPSGKVGEGVSHTYIPTEHLQWMDVKRGAWQDFPTTPPVRPAEFTP